MNRFLMVILAASLLFSCGGSRRTPIADTPADSVDTVPQDTTEVDSLEMLVTDTPMPKAADELFDDFIFNFAANNKLQRERILFPLKKVNGDKTEIVNRDQWKIERYFMRQDYYTLLFDSERSMQVVKDTSVNHAVVEMIYFNTGAVIQHVFDRLRGAWMLTQIQTIPFSQSSNASFLDFYHQFATDSVFQVTSLSENIRFVGPDPDDDFSQMEGVITPDTWSAFAPELPTKMIFNIIYGQPRPEGDNKVFVLRGIANGLEMELTFHRSNGKWRLTKMTT
jgi:hypothetical protein